MARIFVTRNVILTLVMLAILQLWSTHVIMYKAGFEQVSATSEWCVDSNSGILQRIAVNSSNHLYPYVATIFTCGCILVVIIAIIMFGGDL